MQNGILAALLALVLTLVGGLAAAQTTGGGEAAGGSSDGGAADQARALVEVLRDDAARARLIDELERIAGEGTEAGGADDPTEETPDSAREDVQDQPVSVGRRLALITQSAAESVIDTVGRVADQVSALPRAFAGFNERSVARLWDTFGDLVLVILSTAAVFFVLRRLAIPFYRRVGERAGEFGFWKTAAVILATTVVDALVVLLAWGAGYLIALLVFGETGSVAIRQSMYLNAFLVVEMAKVALRAVLSPASGDLRIIGIGDRGARAVSRWLGIVFSLVGYGQLLIVPIVNREIGLTAGRAVSTVLLVLIVILLATLILRSRRAVGQWLAEAVGQTGVLATLARLWWVPALVYLAAIFVIVLIRPGNVLIPVLGASGQILLAVLAAMVASGAIGKAIKSGVHLPGAVSERLPLLERRLNRFVPRALILLRVVLILGVALYALDVVGVIDVGGWLDTDAGVLATGSAVSVLFILLASFLVWLALTSWVDYRLNPDWGQVASARETTLLTLFRNAATIALLVVTLMFVLSEIGIDIAPLLASAGVLGLAIGFGAQKMVQDIITGIFIQFEAAMNVGDVVTVGGTTGTVERLTIRSVSLRDLEGVFHIIPFSSVDMVSNYMRGFAYVLNDMGVAYREDVGEVRDAMHEAFDRLVADEAQRRVVQGGLEWMGVVSFGDNAVVCRVRIKTAPGSQWATGRAYNAHLKAVFDERGIEIPFPQQTLWFGEPKTGDAPSGRIEVVDRTERGPRHASGGPSSRRDPMPASSGDSSAPPRDEDEG